MAMGKMSLKKSTIIALVIALSSGPAILFSSTMIPYLSPNRPALNDLLFAITPFIPWLQYGADFFIISTIVIMAIYLFPKRIHKFPQIVAAIGVMEWVRAFLVVATPLGGPARPNIHYGMTPFIMNGPFPSGHTAFVFMCYLFINKKEEPLIKMILLISVFGEIISLILSRGHYTIDVAGGLLLTYVVYDIFIRYKWFEVKKSSSPVQNKI
jgi:membrane-associated phospholipid phosphatase